MEIAVEIEGRSALLVKDGRYRKDEKELWAGGDKTLKNGMPAMAFISRSPVSKLKEVLKSCAGGESARLGELLYYVPGSSVRGAWRSHLERALRSLDGPPRVCDPLSALSEDGENPPELPDYVSCSSVLVQKDEDRPKQPYSVSCPVCRMFGNTALGSRVAFSDGELKAGEPALIDGIAISRFTGSVAKGANYKVLALRKAKFGMTLRLRNFELWQAGLLAHLFEDLREGRVPLGSGKNRGFGQVRAVATRIAVTEYGRAGEDGELRGVAEHAGFGTEFQRRYGIVAGAPAKVNLAVVEKTLWRRTRATTDASEFWQAVQPCFGVDVWERFPKLESRRALAEA